MGQIITFYSYKGGTGRTMSLANMACLLAQEPNKRVLMIDWDLEAPGLGTYFEPYSLTSSPSEGIVEFILNAQEELPKMEFGEEDHTRLTHYFDTLDSYLTPIDIPRHTRDFFLLKAGNRDAGYAQRAAQIDWQGFFDRIPAFFTCFSEYLSDRFDYVLIDSRTGFTDIGGICTMLMPEKLVLVYTPNHQSLNGVLDLAKQATRYRRKSDDLRPMMLFPLPSRVELEEEALKNEWMHKYKRAFESLFQEVYDLPKTINLDKYFEQAMIRHASRFAYGEKIAVLETEEADIYSLKNAYQSFCVQLTDVEVIWENDPFGSLDHPYRSLFLYVKTDEKKVSEFIKHLHPLRQENVLFWDPEQFIPLEDWSEHLLKGFVDKQYDLAFILISHELEEWFQNDQHFLTQTVLEAINQPNEDILGVKLSKIDDPSGISTLIKLLPHRKKSLDQWDSQDEGWLQIVEGVTKEVIKKIEKDV